MAELITKNLSKHYDGKMIIENINITLHDNEIVCILGISGVGKTTLFNLISGIAKPDSGQIFLDDKNITGKAGEVSYMLQKDLLLPYRTIEDNVSLALTIRGESKKSARASVQKYFHQFGLDGTNKEYPHQLSGGMKQRAALLRTYMFSKGIALLDEPFSSLDTITKSAMQNWYLSVMEEIHLSTLLITHDIDEAILLSDRIYLLSGKPGIISKEIIIKEKKPRSLDFNLTQEFLQYKRLIISKLI